VAKKSRKQTVKLWVEGARLRTLPLAIAPVALGTATVLATNTPLKPALTLLALAVALFLQIGVNYANDYSDGIRGTDANRVGPLRLTGSGSTKPKAVKFAAFLFFGLAGLAGLAIVLITQQWWLIAVGIACIVAAWFYTGGKIPYGYAGLGELAVFVFFGLVATVGTSYIQVGFLDQTAVLMGAAVGFFASAVLMVNNIRDRENDAKVGKRTLAVKVGPVWSRVLFLTMLWLPFVIASIVAVVYEPAVFAWLAALLVAPATVIFVMAKTPKELILVLKLTSMAALVYALLVLVGFAVQ
jgi:1,4-dihydroxy-2-naphthoate octaprenyltransferase